jgi:lipoprotein-anchoring transpeptidase ErfK/SrfK
MTALITISIVALLAHTTTPAAGGTSPTPTHAQSPDAQTPEAVDPLQLQVMLDRAGFSPGTIDGKMGANTRKALELFNSSGLQQPAAVPPTTSYRITAEDMAGPFIDRLPADMMERSKLPSLGYTSVVEELAERFHTTPAFLQQLNRGVSFAADQEIQVPNVEPMVLPTETMSVLEPKQPKANGQRGGSQNPSQPIGTSGTQDAVEKPNLVVTVSKSSSALTATDPTGRVVLYAPVTTGSTHDPLPIGEWKVTSIWFNPAFNYNPDLFWDADPTHTKATLKPGPNNPVGVVWINLSKEHYGLHGTPEPATIGRTQSHGCVRLTNWDALRLAALAKPGTPVIFKE